MVQADIQQHTDLRSRWCRMTYNNTLIYGWHTRHWSTITMVQADIQQDTDLRSRWCRLTYNKTQIYDHDGQASRHVVSELTGCYSWLTGCLACTKCHIRFKNVYRDYRRLTSWMNLFPTCWPATMHWSAQNAILGLKMSTVITVDWSRKWTCSIPLDLQQCTDLWSRLLWTSKMITWSILYCIVLVHVKWQLVLHLFT